MAKAYLVAVYYKIHDVEKLKTTEQMHFPQ